jgi:hypothetical protein
MLTLLVLGAVDGGPLNVTRVGLYWMGPCAGVPSTPMPCGPKPIAVFCRTSVYGVGGLAATIATLQLQFGSATASLPLENGAIRRRRQIAPEL